LGVKIGKRKIWIYKGDFAHIEWKEDGGKVWNGEEMDRDR